MDDKNITTEKRSSADDSDEKPRVGSLVHSRLEAQTHLRNLKQQHAMDPNLPDEFVDEVEQNLAATDTHIQVAGAEHLMDDSPYPEVRAAVRNYDEDMPANTVRAWVIGIIFATIGSALNMLFSMRSPSITITTYVAQLLSHPVGLFWARVMPDRQYKIFGLKFNLNPGPWNLKEHTLVVIMANGK